MTVELSAAQAAQKTKKERSFHKTTLSAAQAAQKSDKTAAARNCELSAAQAAQKVTVYAPDVAL